MSTAPVPARGSTPAKCGVRPFPRSATRIAALLLVAMAALAIATPPLACHLRAIGLLLAVVGAKDPSGLTSALAHGIREQALRVPMGPRGLRAREHVPALVGRWPGIVILHGVHPDGIDEPRLRRFAHAVAATGARVLTPELPELREARVEPTTIDDIAALARYHAARSGGAVGVWGISFAGGLALLAASQPDAAEAVDHVLAIGAHADLARVVRFHRGEDVRGPDGKRPTAAPHVYGTQVLARARIPDLARVSPQGRLTALRVPTFLLHGADDPVVPAIETRYLAREVPAPVLRRVLVTPVLRHAEAAGAPSLVERWRLVRFVAALLDEAAD